jgi:hypothetical protein
MSDFSTKPICELIPGDYIMGNGRFVKVEHVYEKGTLDVNSYDLSNGCNLRCTDDHRLFLASKDGEKEVLASDLRIGDRLKGPVDFVPGAIDMDIEEAWVLGLFVAEGWVEYDAQNIPYRASISSKDGLRKESNKKRAEQFFKSIGVKTNWQPKYLRINDRSWASKLSKCGRYAKNKKFPTTNVNKSVAQAMLDGVNADASVRDLVFSTTSPELAIQVRTLYRIVGQSTHFTKIDNHGGFGKNPIYRITPRNKKTNRDDPKIISISKVGKQKCFDITVTGGRFYLPETDIIVHNCDEFAIYESNVLYNELYNLNKNFINEGMVGAEVLTVCWRKSDDNKFEGHNVCLIKYDDGKFTYMDYGFPSKKVDSIDEIVNLVINKYTSDYHILGWCRMSHDMKFIESNTSW